MGGDGRAGRGGSAELHSRGGSFVEEWRGHHTGHGSHGGAPQLLEFGGAADPLGPSRGIGQQGQQAMVRPQGHSPHLYIGRGLEVQWACGK